MLSIFSADINYSKMIASFDGWQAYAKWADSFRLRKRVIKEIHKAKISYKNNQMKL